MFKGKYAAVMAAALMASSALFGGCADNVNSAEDLFAAMNEKTADTKSFDAEVSLVLDMDYTVGENSDNMKLDFKAELTSVLDTKEVYIDGSMNVTDVYNEAWQTYLIENGGGYASYTCADGEWYYDEVDGEYLSGGPSNLFKLLSGISNCSFEKGSDYVLEADADSEIIINILNSFYSNVMENAFSDGLDTSGLSAKLILRFYKDTCLPKSLELVFNDCSDMFIGENMFDEAVINDFKLSAVFDDYNKTDDIDIPANVAEMFELPSDNGDKNGREDETMTFDDSEDLESDSEGFYELTDYGKKKNVGIKAPEGFKFNRESDASLISFDKTGKTNGYCTAVYELKLISDNYTKAEAEGYAESLYNFYSSDDDYSDMEYISAESIDSEGRQISYSGLKYRYAGDDYTAGGYSTMYSYWTYIGDYVLICNVTDYASDGFEEFNAVEMAGLLFGNIRE